MYYVELVVVNICQYFRIFTKISNVLIALKKRELVIPVFYPFTIAIILIITGIMNIRKL